VPSAGKSGGPRQTSSRRCGLPWLCPDLACATSSSVSANTPLRSIGYAATRFGSRPPRSLRTRQSPSDRGQAGTLHFKRGKSSTRSRGDRGMRTKVQSAGLTPVRPSSTRCPFFRVRNKLTVRDFVLRGPDESESFAREAGICAKIAASRFWPIWRVAGKWLEIWPYGW
jgi:hypothetical protein